MKFDKISKVGIEIEGGWWMGFEHPSFHNDISILHEQFKTARMIGEIVSQPSSKFEDVADFIYKYWPIETTDRCAFHIHFSLHNLNDYVTCMDNQFYLEFLRAMADWGNSEKCENKMFWDRLRKKNKYCAGDFIPDIQVACRTKDEARQRLNNGMAIRYTHLNYCYHQYGTIENRLFPTFSNPYFAYSGTLAFLNFVENYLKKNIPSDTVVDEGIEETETTPTCTTFKLKKFNYLNMTYHNKKMLRVQ